MALACEERFDTDGSRQDTLVRRALWAGWIALGLLLVCTLLPLRYSARTELTFDAAMPPPTAVVRGVTQLVQSRAVAFDVTQTLGARDMRRIADQSGLRLTALWRRADADDGALAARAVRVLDTAVRTTIIQGGRGVDITVTLADAGLAARVADAYAGTLLSLDASVRGGLEGAHDPAPPLRLAHAAQASRLPDMPTPVPGLLLAGAGVLLTLLSLHTGRRAPRAEGRVAEGILPREIPTDRRVAWLRSALGDGLGPHTAIERLVETVATAGQNDLVVLTSEDLPDLAATCAVALARRLAEGEDQIVLVALDGEAPAFAHVLTDPRAPGVAELLFGVAGFSEAIHRDPGSRAHLIPPGRDSLGGPRVVGADRLPLILDALRRTYRRVIVAAPPLAGTAGATRLAGLAPLLIAIHEDMAVPTAAVETYDVLAAEGFTNVAMLPLRLDADGQPDSLPSPLLPRPSLSEPLRATAPKAA